MMMSLFIFSSMVIDECKISFPEKESLSLFNYSIKMDKLILAQLNDHPTSNQLLYPPSSVIIESIWKVLGTTSKQKILSYPSKICVNGSAERGNTPWWRFVPTYLYAFFLPLAQPIMRSLFLWRLRARLMTTASIVTVSPAQWGLNKPQLH